MTILQRWANDNLIDSESIKYKIKITGNTPVDGNTRDVEIVVTLKYLVIFGKLLNAID